MTNNQPTQKMKKLFSNLWKNFQFWRLRRRFARATKMATERILHTKAKYPNSEGIFCVTETWPAVSSTTPGFTIKGKTTIMWGTNGVLSSPFPASGGFYAVLRVTQKPILDRSKLPNGAGVTTSDVFIQDGVTMELTVRDDSTMIPPVVNTTAIIVDVGWLINPSGNPGGGAAPLLYTGRVVDMNYDTALKQPGERVLMIDNLVLIDSQTTSGQSAR
jgi:hypothetical protein